MGRNFKSKFALLASTYKCLLKAHDAIGITEFNETNLNLRLQEPWSQVEKNFVAVGDEVIRKYVIFGGGLPTGGYSITDDNPIDDDFGITLHDFKMRQVSVRVHKEDSACNKTEPFQLVGRIQTFYTEACNYVCDIDITGDHVLLEQTKSFSSMYLRKQLQQEDFTLKQIKMTYEAFQRRFIDPTNPAYTANHRSAPYATINFETTAKEVAGFSGKALANAYRLIKTCDVQECDSSSYAVGNGNPFEQMTTEGGCPCAKYLKETQNVYKYLSSHRSEQMNRYGELLHRRMLLSMLRDSSRRQLTKYEEIEYLPPLAGQNDNTGLSVTLLKGLSPLRFQDTATLCDPEKRDVFFVCAAGYADGACTMDAAGKALTRQTVMLTVIENTEDTTEHGATFAVSCLVHPDRKEKYSPLARVSIDKVVASLTRTRTKLNATTTVFGSNMRQGSREIASTIASHTADRPLTFSWVQLT